jgi:RNA polymerase sigma factor (sigma-70 family)
MSILDETYAPFSPAEEAQLIQAAQAGCRVSLDRLMAAYEDQIGQVIALQGRGRLSEAEAWQAGRHGLWQAILSYEPHSPGRFWCLSAAIGQVSTAIWQEVKRVEWQERVAGWYLTGLNEAPAQADPAQRWAASQVQAVLGEMVAALPARLQQVMVAYYGLDGTCPATYRQIGLQLGYSHTRIWQWHQEALARLSHPSGSYRLRSLLGRHTLTDYLAARRRTRRWLRRRGGRPPEPDDVECG